ncbi:unnamed protein product [Rotaria sp. Silwood2]|nr:unnamed protein product [Rotaria sp. Silwood2]CAF4247253.1 unnamed protein product [Rotaria sp. Silwood2]
MHSSKILAHPPEQQQQQQQPIPMIIGSSKKSLPYSMISQYEPPTVAYNESLKNNKVAPPQVHDSQLVNQAFPNNSFLSPSSLTSTNPLIPYSFISQQEPQHNANKYIDQSKTNKKNSKHQSAVSTVNANYNNRSHAFYNQSSDGPETAAKNRPNNTRNSALQSDIDDDETKPQGKWGQWLSQPLCLGLTRLSGGVLFGSMILLACGSIAGLIASIALFVLDSETNSQWKILGMVICSIMLITIIATVLIFICCYKHGYMDNSDDDIDPITISDFKQNERQKAAIRTYKLDSINHASSIPSGILQDVSTPSSMPKLSCKVHDKQTNTETSIAPLRPKDFNRGVWPAINAFGGIADRSKVRPRMISRVVQVLPHEIEETLETKQVINKIVVPPTAVTPPPQVQQRIIYMPDEKTSVIDAVETTTKQPRIASIREVQKQNIVVQPKPRVETAHVEEQRTHRIENIDSRDEQPHRAEHVDSSDEESHPIEHIDTKKKQAHRIEHVDSNEEQPHHVDTKEKQTHRTVQKPQHEIVEEVNERARSSSIEEIVDVPKHGKKHGRKKDKKQSFGKVSVKHVKPTN